MLIASKLITVYQLAFYCLFSPEHNPGAACLTFFQLTYQSLQCKTPFSLFYLTSESSDKCQCGFHYRDGALIVIRIVTKASTVYRTAVSIHLRHRNCSNFMVFPDASGLCPYRSNILPPGLESIFKLRINMYAVVPAKI